LKSAATALVSVATKRPEFRSNAFELTGDLKEFHAPPKSMSIRVATREVTIALVGNPNTGKSTLFNALTGVRQRVGNYPGVTVEKKIGRYSLDDSDYSLIDLPGTYSLAPRSPDEMIAVDVLLGRRADVTPPDVILCIVDASNLQRNLYVVSQVL